MSSGSIWLAVRATLRGCAEVVMAQWSHTSATVFACAGRCLLRQLEVIGPGLFLAFLHRPTHMLLFELLRGVFGKHCRFPRVQCAFRIAPPCDDNSRRRTVRLCCVWPPREKLSWGISLVCQSCFISCWTCRPISSRPNQSGRALARSPALNGYLPSLGLRLF